MVNVHTLSNCVLLFLLGKTGRLKVHKGNALFYLDEKNIEETNQKYATQVAWPATIWIMHAGIHTHTS